MPPLKARAVEIPAAYRAVRFPPARQIYAERMDSLWGEMLPAPEVQLKRLSEGLQLTDVQQKQIRPMLDEEYASLKVIRQDENLSPKQIQAKVEALRTETIAKIQTVLSPGQKENLDLVSDEVKANKQQRMQENRKTRLGTNADPPQ